MPYEWLPPEGTARRLHLWPHRSLGPRGFVAFIAITAGFLALPLLALLGSVLMWGLLPFLLAAVAAIWAALRRNQRDTEIVEDLCLTPDQITLTRHGPRGQRHDWDANPHWVRVRRYSREGPVPHYLTLKGMGREVEIGAFLSEAERLSLEVELQTALAATRPA